MFGKVGTARRAVRAALSTSALPNEKVDWIFKRNSPDGCDPPAILPAVPEVTMKKITLKLFALLIFITILSGCGISPYRKEVGLMFVGFGGYAEYPQKDGIYQVCYSSGHAAFRSKEKVHDFALRRACELTIEKGFKAFRICDEWNNEYHCVLDISLTNSCEENVLDAKETLITLRKKYE